MRVLTLAGSGAQRGLDYGRENGAAIGQAATALKAHLAASGHPPAALIRRLSTDPLTHTAADLVPDLWAEVTTIAHSARVDLDELLLLVFAPDLAAYAAPGSAEPTERPASTATFGGSAAARTIAGKAGDPGVDVADSAQAPIPPTTEIGQTVDLPSWARQRMQVLRIGAFDAPNALLLAHPGSPGLCGANQSGLGVATTALPNAPVTSRGLGVAFVVRHLLTLETLTAAEDFLMSIPHTVGRAYLIAARDGIGCFEADASGVRPTHAAGATALAHTDHRLAASEQESMRADESTRTRLDTLTRMIDDGRHLDTALGPDLARDGVRWQDPLFTVGAFRARGSDASARFVDGDSLLAGRDWSRLTYS